MRQKHSTREPKESRVNPNGVRSRAGAEEEGHPSWGEVSGEHPFPRAAGCGVFFFLINSSHLYFPQVFVLRAFTRCIFYSLLNKQTYCRAACETRGVAGVCCTKPSFKFQSCFTVLLKYGLTLFIKLLYIGRQGSKMLIRNELQLNLW